MGAAISKGERKRKIKNKLDAINDRKKEMG